MRIVYLGNNWVGWQILEWLREQDDEIVGLVIHPEGRRKFGEEILRASGLPAVRIFDGSQLQNLQILESIRALKPDWGISVYFGYIIEREFLEIFSQGCINVHSALLPYNRGAYPNVWSIVDGTPAGVTIHYVDPGVDTGDIIAQREMPVEPVDTGETLYRKLEFVSVEIFKDTWHTIRTGNARRMSQNPKAGTKHRVKDVEQIDEIDLERIYKAKELIDVLRARTFGNYPGAYFRHDRRKVYIRVSLEYENEFASKA